jgi:hypothetical protein
VPGLDVLDVLPLRVGVTFSPVATMFAYAGPGPGLELIPSFLGLLACAGMALGAVLLWPLSALLRRLREGNGNDEDRTTAPTIVPEPGEQSQGPTNE